MLSTAPRLFANMERTRAARNARDSPYKSIFTNPVCKHIRIQVGVSAMSDDVTPWRPGSMESCLRSLRMVAFFAKHHLGATTEARPLSGGLLVMSCGWVLFNVTLSSDIVVPALLPQRTARRSSDSPQWKRFKRSKPRQMQVLMPIRQVLATLLSTFPNLVQAPNQSVWSLMTAEVACSTALLRGNPTWASFSR
jgi:hypothetical protein